MKHLLIACTLVLGFAPVAEAKKSDPILTCGHHLFPPCEPLEIFVWASLYG